MLYVLNNTDTFIWQLRSERLYELWYILIFDFLNELSEELVFLCIGAGDQPKWRSNPEEWLSDLNKYPVNNWLFLLKLNKEASKFLYIPINNN